MEHLSPMTLPTFLLQLVILLSYIPVTLLAYRRLRVPQIRKIVRLELSQFQLAQGDDFEETLNTYEYDLAQYAFPLMYIVLILAALYAMTHPFVIGSGLWAGLLEELVDVFGISKAGSPIADAPGARAMLVGRGMFWCWIGAYVHSVDRTVRHYLAHDLTPSVYIYGARRFTVAFIVGSIVGIGVGAFTTATEAVSLNTNLAMVYVVSFAIGLFPDRGLKWIQTTANRILRQPDETQEQARLAELDGMGAWQQGRMDQEGIANVQNLAAADLMLLIVNTPFNVGQIIDWLDQAILVVYAGAEQLSALKQVGLRRASDVLRAVESRPDQTSAATGLDANELQLLCLALQSAVNFRAVVGFRERTRTGPKQPQ